MFLAFCLLFIVYCLLLFVVCCLLFVVCCLWFVVCRLSFVLFVVCGLWFVICFVCGLWFVLFVVCGLWFVVCGLWFVVCGLWFVVCGSWFVVVVVVVVVAVFGGAPGHSSGAGAIKWCCGQYLSAHGARSAWGALHRPFYCKSTVADRTKLQVFQATSMSKHIYNAHTWSKISPADLNNWIQKLRPMLYSFAREFLHGQAPFKFSIEVLAGIIQFLSPLDQLHISRLRYLKRLTRYCPAVLWRVLCEVQSEPHSWIAHCRQSLQWFQKFHKKAPNLPVEAPFYQWTLAASEDISWTGKLKKAAWSCIQLRYSEAQYAIWLDHFEVQFVTAGGVIADRLQVPTEEWRCEICSEQFGSKRALAMHAHKKHQYRKIAKYFAMDGLCSACMKQFHCRSRLCNHLNGRGRCLDILQAVFPPLPEEVVEQLDQEDRETAHQLKQEGWRSTKAFEPAITQLGPQVPRPGDEGLADFRRRWDLRTGAPGTAFHNLQGYCASINHANEADCHDTPKFVMQSAGGQCDGAGLLGTGGLAKMAACLHSVCALLFGLQEAVRYSPCH